ncbi:LysR family transcriptional regulator [Rhizobium sp. EC-SD404]|uniref:LysR family transcriptional regulator n=1 Tax=Rhizobium sp. EC-SD404 TaxID=2038389 RepID=UPI001259CAF7|nr:LysR family transcriptional regulator [Rhizobium sp. EC-SD404]VVT24844.1 conserved hypothetical protein [Rhizobium sp. EC-SD404]
MVPEIETRQLTNFLAVAERGGFRRAAESLSVGQSSVSRQIQRLEDMLGVSLFERRADGARLTVAGACLATRARLIIDELKAARKTAQVAGVGRNGHLTLGVILSLSRGAARDVLSNFIRSHDKVEIAMVESDRSDLLSKLSHRRIDLVAACGEPHLGVGDGFTLCHEAVFLATAADTVLADRPLLSWDDVRNERFIISSREPGPEIHDHVVSRVGRVGRQLSVRRHRMGREGIMDLVGMGFGVSLVPDQWRGVGYPNVAFVPIGGEGDRVPFSLTWRPENDNPALRRFLSLARIEARRNGSLS